MIFVLSILLLVVMYFAAVRPQQKRLRAHQELVSSIEVGDEIISASGIFGTITSVDPDRDAFGFLVAPGVEVTLARQAVARRAPAEGVAEDAVADDSAADAPQGAGSVPDDPDVAPAPGDLAIERTQEAE